MLGIIGLLGALVAGVVGDALMAMAHKDDDAGDAPADAVAEATPTGDLLADDDPSDAAAMDPDPAFPEDGSPDPADDARVPDDDLPDQVTFGADADEFIIGGPEPDWIMGTVGDDTIDGAADHDTLSGGTGDDHLTGVADDAADHLHGGAGDDTLVAGAGDTARGDTGADEFTLTDYAPGDPPAIITDYAPGEDRIVLMYDADLHPEPMVQTEAIEGTEDVSVLLDGIQIAIVQGAAGLEFADIQLLAA